MKNNLISDQFIESDDRFVKELQDYVDNAVIGLHWVDEHGIIKWANTAELNMLGYTEAEYIGHHISEFHADQKKIDDILKRLTKNEVLKGYEAELICKNGDFRHVNISSNVYREDGRFIHTRCFTVDITEQKILFHALVQSETKYRSLLEHLPIAIYTTDSEGTITFYNKAASDLWGRKPVIGKDKWCGSYEIRDIEGNKMPLATCPMPLALKEGRPLRGHEIIIVRPDGEKRNVLANPKPIYNDKGNIEGAVNMLVDISMVRSAENKIRESEGKLKNLTDNLEVKVAERTSALSRNNEELKKSEERYHAMIEEVEDYAIVLLSKEGIIQNWNKGAEKIKGYTEKEIIGQSFRNFYREDDRKEGLPERLLKEAKEKGKATHEGWRLRKNGSTFWGSIVITALHDAQRNVIGFSKVTRDLTEKKIAEDKLREYTTQLEFQNNALEQFAYAASHDMKEPLRKIGFYNNYIIENSKTELDVKSKEYLNRSMTAVKKLSSLIEDLLTYSKANSAFDNFEETDLNEIVEEIILSHKDMSDAKIVRIEAGHLPVTWVIPFQFKQLMDNLINNSIKYKHPDRESIIKITGIPVKGSDIKSQDADKRRNYIKISIADNGIGFDQKHAEKIFEIFQRLTNQSSYKGSGIGLALCKKIIQNHQGIIQAFGTDGEGARFDIYFPS